ncbi:hypothetical protein BS50DRAFT_128408 [Corynespora cassiicola Philippines]|uniref:Clr5 domain-containing protein n=1 Tax=Corynespora cassiicola Philippines TaxID=1448308 RepID=A0A2T2NBJ4_CORCC|nr:hypothetical protein BS50DRAFT_128408 [Corynespora cassiicola Philippines]
MPRKAGGPSPAEWERNKSEIVSLASQHKWTVVRDIMESRHGFVASPDQYTARMKIWRANKNLKESEWRGAIDQYDRLASRHYGKEIRMLILGKVVGETKIKRSRAKCCRSNSGISF